MILKKIPGEACPQTPLDLPCFACNQCITPQSSYNTKMVHPILNSWSRPCSTSTFPTISHPIISSLSAVSEHHMDLRELDKAVQRYFAAGLMPAMAKLP